MDSILTSIKKMLGITEDYTHFDTDIVIHINSVFSILTQLGVGPPEGFYIQDKTTIWYEYISDPNKIEMDKSYMYLKVRLLFDPPSSSSVIEAFNKQISEFEWRLNVAVETS